MKTIWQFEKDSGSVVARMFKHKVCDVYQQRTPQFIRWSGSLDNDDYFLIFLIDGCIMASVADREMFLGHDIKRVAKPLELCEIMESQDGSTRAMRFLEYKLTEVPKLMLETEFADIMEIFMWEYVSTEVEIYENISL